MGKLELFSHALVYPMESIFMQLSTLVEPSRLATLNFISFNPLSRTEASFIHWLSHMENEGFSYLSGPEGENYGKNKLQGR